MKRVASLLFAVAVAAFPKEPDFLPIPSSLTTPESAKDAEIRERAGFNFKTPDVASMPEGEWPAWCKRFKANIHIRSDRGIDYYSCKWLVLLVQLKDEETTNWLLSETKRGFARGTQASSILGASKQTWLLPKLEKALFLQPEDEPRNDHPGDLMFPSVSESAFGALIQIIKDSNDFTPRLKSWFEIIRGEPGLGRFGNETGKIVAQWWNVNRDKIRDGEYRILGPIPLWDADKPEDDAAVGPFGVADFWAALKSTHPIVVCYALRKIGKEDEKVPLETAQLEPIARFLDAKDGMVRALCLGLLGTTGERGAPYLRAALSHPDSTVRGDAAGQLLRMHPDSAAERARCVAALVAHDSFSYLANDKDLKVEAMPLLRRRIIDKTLPDSKRTSAAFYLAHYADADDLPSLEVFLKPVFPLKVRESIIITLTASAPVGHPPQSIRNAQSDPELGAIVKRWSHLGVRPAESGEAQKAAATDGDVVALVSKLGGGRNDASKYLRSHPDLRLQAKPLLKQQVQDSTVPKSSRSCAALLLAAWAMKDDLPYFESLLDSSYPGNVRAAAIHAIFRIKLPDGAPASVRALTDDPELGVVLMIYRYLEKSN